MAVLNSYTGWQRNPCCHRQVQDSTVFSNEDQNALSVSLDVTHLTSSFGILVLWPLLVLQSHVRHTGFLKDFFLIYC